MSPMPQDCTRTIRCGQRIALSDATVYLDEVPKNEKRDVRITLRVSQAEADALSDFGDKFEMTMSEVIRKCTGYTLKRLGRGL